MSMNVVLIIVSSWFLCLTPGEVSNKWLLLGWVTVCDQVNHVGM